MFHLFISLHHSAHYWVFLGLTKNKPLKNKSLEPNNQTEKELSKEAKQRRNY